MEKFVHDVETAQVVIRNQNEHLRAARDGVKTSVHSINGLSEQVSPTKERRSVAFGEARPLFAEGGGEGRTPLGLPRAISVDLAGERREGSTTPLWAGGRSADHRSQAAAGAAAGGGGGSRHTRSAKVSPVASPSVEPARPAASAALTPRSVNSVTPVPSRPIPSLHLPPTEARSRRTKQYWD